MESLLTRARLLGMVGVVSLLVASVVAFGWGAVKTVKASYLIIASLGQDPKIAILLIELIDSFLVATVLFVFAASMYELFIDKLALPDWMLAHNLRELKDKLGGVIILVTVVKFLERLVEWKDPYDSLLYAIAVTLVSASLIALSHFSGKD